MRLNQEESFMSENEIKETQQDTVDEHEIPVTIENSSNQKPEPASESDAAKEADVDYLQLLQRLQAEFDNYRKRTEKEKGQQYLFGKSQLMLQLLPVLDDFERLLGHHGQEGKEDTEATRLIYQKLLKTLIDEGLRVIITKDEDFNPDLHEALSMEEVDTEELDHRILETWQKGFLFNERLLRPARVKIGKFVVKGNEA
ncbi:MAG: nucleotide exchange factor GrpE [Bacteroidales bacterium]|nr:nucleotide exchange factor GrpE [Bacteroidales bacterium]